MSETKVLSAWPLSELALERLRAVAGRVEDVSGRNLSPEQFKAELADTDGLIVFPLISRIDAATVAAAPKLRVIATVAVGYDNIDLAACRARGIKVGNTPGVISDATADVAMALILGTMRRVVRGVDFIRAGNWGRGEFLPYGNDLARKLLGIFGMGGIGTALARRARAAGMRVQYSNRNPRPEAVALEAAYVGFEELLRTSDVIVVSAPLNAETRGKFGRDAFAMMKPSAYFVNVARGGLVQTDALYEALRDGKIAFAGLDVTDPEPLPIDHPLWTLPNLLVTPHIGTSTYETRDEMLQLAVSNVIAGLRGEALPAELH